MELGFTAKLYSGTGLVSAAYLGDQLIFRNISAQNPVSGIIPELCFDFVEDAYATGARPSKFDSAITHTRASNATMVDSDGVLKWAPHNLLPYSEGDGSNVSPGVWSLQGSGTGDVTISTLSNGFGGLTIEGGQQYLRLPVSLVAEATYTLKVYIEPGATYVGQILRFDGFSGISLPIIASMSDAVDGVVSLTATLGTDGDGAIFVGPISADAGVVQFGGFHLYRSDLGGMVDNPDRGDSYVPTTSAARYLARRGHHVYNGAEWVNEGVLVESEARTNLITYSDLSANINPAGATLTANIASGIDGETSAATLIEDTSTGVHRFTQSVSPTITSGAPYSASIYAKANGRTEIRLSENAATGAYATFNLLDGSIVSSGLGGSGVTEDMGNGWYRCTMTFTSAGTVGRIDVSLLSSGSISYTGDGASGVYLYGEQLEAGSTPSSYIPTSGVTVTRAADTLTVPSANLPWPAPNVIGPELVTNGTFDTDTTGWSGHNATSVLSVVDQKLRVTSTSTSTWAYQIISTEVGRVYKITADVSNVGGANTQVWVGNASGNADWLLTNLGTSDQTFEGYFVAQGTSAYIQFVGNTVSGQSTDWDNISVCEINPLAVSIQMSGTMTYADTGSGAEVFPFFWADGQNYVGFRVNTVSTLTGRPQFIQKDGTTEDIVQGAVNYYSPGVNVPFNIASRHGSTFINGAVDGVALTADTTPVALPDLSSTDLRLGYDYMGTIKLFRIWANDLGDAGIAEAST